MRIVGWIRSALMKFLKEVWVSLFLDGVMNIFVFFVFSIKFKIKVYEKYEWK